VITLWQDLRYAARMLRKAPGATLVAVLALALGIGLNTSVFCVLSAALWRPLQVEHADQLVGLVGGTEEERRFSGGLSYPDYVDLRDQNQVFSGLLAFQFNEVALSTGESRRGGGMERGEIIRGEMVTGNYFDVLGVRAALGRTFAPEEGRTLGTHPVVVLSHSLWQRRFNADPQIIGRTIHLNNTSLTVIGIAPKTFKGAVVGFAGDWWAPMMMRTPLAEYTDDWIRDRSRRDVTVLGRLRPGAGVAAAQANVSLIWQNLVNQFPATNKGATVSVVPEIQARYGTGFDQVRLASMLAQLVAALVLLVSCANVANLLLAKATGRIKEIAIRQALGASRWRLVRQLVTESVLLALLGGALGLIVAFWCGDLFLATLPTQDVAFDYDFTPDLRAFAGALGISLLTGVLFGLVPALRSSRVVVAGALKSDVAAEGQSLRRFGLRHALVIAQLAVSIVVVTSGALFVRSLRKIEAVDPGIRQENLASMLLDPGMLDYQPAECGQYFSRLISQVETIPGVRSATIASFVPLNGVFSEGPVVKEGEPPPLPNQGMEVTYTVVGAKYFETAGTELVLGREFTGAEHEGVPSTAIVNQEMARRLYGDEHRAIGRRFRVGAPDSALLEIVGVARDGKYVFLTDDPRPHMFLPEMPPSFQASSSTGRALMVRTASPRDLPLVAQRMRTGVQDLDARVAIQIQRLGDEHLRGALYLPRVAATVGMVLGVVALFLATMGIYSVMAYGVSQRTREIGIRMALGGQPRDVLRLVMRQGALLIVFGLAVGSGVAFFAARMESGFLFGVGAADPVAFLGTVVLLGLVAVLATFIPARRATRVSPMIALRYE
jgi:macrolide transport system ATP-binding/permease protein